MADNTLQNGTDNIATDELTTINGAAAPVGLKVQRVKVGHGVDGDFKDATAADPLPVTVGNFPATQAVSGTVAVSNMVAQGLTDAQLRLTAVPVSGAFFQATQPVSAASLPLPTGAGTEATLAGVRTDLGADGTTPPAVLGAGTGVRGWLRSIYEKLTGTIAVTGTFFQATQPVSLAANTPDVTDRAARALGTIANTAFTANAGTNLNTSALALDATLTGGTTKAIVRGGAKGTAVAGDITSNPVDANTQALHVNLAGVNAVNATLGAETTKVIGTVNIAAAQTLATVTTVSAVTAITNALPTGANVIGALTANQSVNNAQINGVAPLMGNGVTGTGSQRVTIASDNTAFPVNATLTAETTKVIGTVNPPALTKATQGANGFTTQDLKDAGRNPTHYYMVIPVLTSATDTLQSLTGTKGGVTVTATATPAVVTTGKTYRVTRVAATYIATATSGYGIVRLRFNTAGLAAITSPIAVTLTVGSGTPATANATGMEEATVSDGWEFAAGTGVGISVQGFAAVTATAVGYMIVSLTGYEY